MPSIQCRCGEVLRYGEIPNPIEWLLISDREFDSFSGVIESERLYRKMRSLLQCPDCKRLWVYWDGFGQDPTEYACQT